MRLSKNLTATFGTVLFGLLGYPVMSEGIEPAQAPFKISTGIAIAVEGAAENSEPAQPQVRPAVASATHYENKRVVLRDTEKGRSLQTFCVGSDGRVFAIVAKGFMDGAVQGDGGEIRVLSASGEDLATWKTEFTPQRMAAAPDGSIVVGGFGQLARFSPEGKSLAQVASPHLTAVLGDKAALRKAAEVQQAEALQQYQEQIDQFDEQIKILEEQIKAEEAAKKKEPAQKNEADEKEKKLKQQEEQPAAGTSSAPPTSAGTFFGVTLFGGSSASPTTSQQLSQFRQMRKSYEQVLDRHNKTTLEDIENQIAARLQRIHGIAVGDDAVYIATAMSKGYGYAVWRTTADFGEAKQIISGLSGCCGQIDIQARGDDLFVAENSRHRVVRYNRDGKQLGAWGKRDRDGAAGGFGGCCNPMNLCFMPDGTVVTSESEGLMKCFSSDGKYSALLGNAKVGGGCKNVAVAVSPDATRAYFYDQQGSQIIVFEKSSAEEPPKKPADGKQASLQ